MMYLVWQSNKNYKTLLLCGRLLGTIILYIMGLCEFNMFQFMCGFIVVYLLIKFHLTVFTAVVEKSKATQHLTIK